MQVIRLQVIKRKNNKKNRQDTRQYNRICKRSYKGGLPRGIISKYNELHKEAQGDK